MFQSFVENRHTARRNATLAFKETSGPCQINNTRKLHLIPKMPEAKKKQAGHGVMYAGTPEMDHALVRMTLTATINYQ